MALVHPVFLAAAVLTAIAPGKASLWAVVRVPPVGFQSDSFLIGSGITRKAVRQIGWRPLAMAVSIWLIVSVVTLCCIERGWIAL